MKKSRKSKVQKKLSPMAYLLSVGALVIVSAYAHVQFRADLQEEAYRAVASDQKKVIQFSQLNAVEVVQEESPSAPNRSSEGPSLRR